MANSQHNTLFVILARGGSKRFPGKNLAPVGGASLVARAVRCAQGASHRLSNPCRIVVSTDDDAIAEEAHRCGAEVPFVRPADAASDNATSVDAIRHAVDWFGERSVTFSEVVLLQPTSPLRSLNDVVQTIRGFRQFPDRSHVTVALRPASSGRAGYRLGADGLLHTHDVNAAGSTDHSIVKLNGAVYVCSPSWLASHDSLCVSGQSHGLTMPASRSVDVDREEDLACAQRVFDQRLPWSNDRCFVIAEAGVNHNGCMDTARRLIEAAANAGADAVKFQTFSADRLATQQAPKAAYQERHQPGGESQFEMLRRLELSPDQHGTLIDDCRDHDIAFLSSAFSPEDVDLLDALDVSAIKLGSAEITNHPLLAYAAQTMRPIILSTGCSWLEEVQEAVEVILRSGCDHLALLHCVSAYPAPIDDVNLNAMTTMANATGLAVGFSDHTQGIALAGVAVSLGARIIEKHFTLDRTMPGPDHQASLEPDELKEMIATIRNVEIALGDGIKRPMKSEMDTRRVARRSLVAAQHLPTGTILRSEHLATKRPGTAIAPSKLHDVLGQLLIKPVSRDELLTWDHLAPVETV